ncbi:MAG TPA: hypothetical protein DCS21_01485 [Gammaproteobacteria bacterium]|nr:hypothetical protein [Gammaproteobacteria bacterium]
MRHALRNLKTFGLYLLPAALLVLCGGLLTALFNPPTPVAPPVPAVATMDEAYWQAHAEAMFLALLIDALRQSQDAREIQARTLIYAEPLSTGQRPALIRL